MDSREISGRPVGLQGENLIYLISQPRAGSTLLQRILATSHDIHTLSEPYLMLHPLYALRSSGYTAEYYEKLAREATVAFLDSIPGGEAAYVDGIRRMYSHLYGLALEQSGKRYFLDKTPPYYFIIPELAGIFPDARYIILLRNPLAVLSSIMMKWLDRDWLRIRDFGSALLRAPRLLLDGIDHVGSRCLVVHYEKLVEDPETQVSRMCAWLNIGYCPAMVDYGHANLPRWTLGDSSEIYLHHRPMGQNATKWIQSLEHPQFWRYSHDYLHALGKPVVEQMGYSFDGLNQVLEEHRPSNLRLWRTVPLSLAVEETSGVKRSVRNIWISGARRLTVAASSTSYR